MVGLALEGGGAKGAYQIGAYMALKKCHVKINAVCGTSIGSFNGALIASHEEKKLLELWKDASMSSLLGIDEVKAMQILNGNLSIDNIKWSLQELYKIFKNKGLDMSNYRAMVRNNIDEEKVRNSNIRYGLTTVKLDNKFEPEEVYIEDMPSGTLHDYIVASSYLPVFKKEKLVDDNYYIDGGFYNLCPTDMLERIGCDKIYTINIKGIGIRKNNNPRVEIIEIKPNNSLGSILIFDKKSNENNIKYGYYDTLKVFNRLDGIKYYFKKKNDKYYTRITRKVDNSLKNAVSALLNVNNDKDLVLKSLEMILKERKYSDLKIYKIKEVTKLIKNENSDNIVYQFVKNLKA